MVRKILFGLTVFAFVAACNNPKSNGEKDETPADTMALQVSSAKIMVEGMTCDGCEKTVETRVAKLDGVTEVDASHTDASVVVKYDASKVDRSDLTAAIDKAGYKVVEQN